MGYAALAVTEAVQFVLVDDKGGPDYDDLFTENPRVVDGMVEIYFRSAEDIRSMFAGPIPAMMRKDEENFVQMDAPAVRLVSEEFGAG